LCGLASRYLGSVCNDLNHNACCGLTKQPCGNKCSREQEMGKRILITGVTGFVGAAVSRSFLAAGYRVRALVRTSAQADQLRAAGIEPVIGDLSQPQSLPPALADCTYLAHVAADYRLFVPGD